MSTKTNNSKTGKPAMYVLIVILAVLVLIAGIKKYVDWSVKNNVKSTSDIAASMKAGDGFPYLSEPDSIKGAALCEGNLLVLKNDSAVLLSSTAKEMSSVEHGLINPVMKVKGNHIIMYDLDSGKFKVCDGTVEKKSYEMGGKIICADVCKNGGYAVGAFDPDVASKFIAYDNGHNKVYEWNFKSEYVSSVSLSDDGKTAAVSTMYGDNNGTVSSKIYVFDFSGKEAKYKFDFPSSSLLSVSFSKGNILAFGDNVRVYIKNGKEKPVCEKLGDNALSGFSIAPDGSNLVSVSQYGSSSLGEYRLYKKNNKLKKDPVSLTKKVRWTDCDGKYAAILSDNEISVYNYRGKCVGTKKADFSPDSILLDGKKLFAVSSSQIYCFNVRGDD